MHTSPPSITETPSSIPAPTPSTTWCGCFARGSLAPSPAVAARCAPVFDEIRAAPGGRQRWVHRAAVPLNFTHKAVLLGVVGAAALVPLSWGQLSAVLALQVGMVAYLVAVAPYATWQLQALEVAAHCLEGVVFMLAVVAAPRTMGVHATHAAVGTMVCVTVLLVAYDVHSLVTVVALLIRTRREKRAAAEAAGGKDGGGDGEGGSDPGKQALPGMEKGAQ